jgi:hypothetical protein
MRGDRDKLTFVFYFLCGGVLVDINLLVATLSHLKWQNKITFAADNKKSPCI